MPTILWDKNAGFEDESMQ